MQYLDQLFADEPETWGLRGDKCLWRELAETFKGVRLPSNIKHLKRLLEQAFYDLVGESLSFCEEVLVERFAHGGMSSRYVDGSFWRERGFPLVIDRFSGVEPRASSQKEVIKTGVFDKKTEEEIGFYVYALIDPRSGMPFYIGKGVGNRVFAHARDALENASATDKLDTIREIVGSGESVEHVVVRHGLTEEMAFAIETALIDFARSFDLGLTNIVLGHKSSAFGIMTADELHRKYSAEPLKELGEGCVIININKKYKRAKGTKSYYDAAKEMWVINPKRIPSLRYVLAEYAGFIVDVFEVDENGWYEKEDDKGKIRWGFDGEQAPEEIRSRYLNRKIEKKRGAANPVRYTIG